MDIPAIGNYVSLCSGVGMLDAAIRLACPAARCRCYVEIEAFASEVLVSRMQDGSLDDAPVWSNLNTFDPRPWRGHIEMVAGGFPCVDISQAGKGEGIKKGNRSGLWFEFERIICDMEPRWVFLENVAAISIRGMDVVLGSMARLGYDAEWTMLKASEIGAPHQRKRWFCLAQLADTGSHLTNDQQKGRGTASLDSLGGGSADMADTGRERLFGWNGLHSRGMESQATEAEGISGQRERLRDTIGDGKPAVGHAECPQRRQDDERRGCTGEGANGERQAAGATGEPDESVGNANGADAERSERVGTRSREASRAGPHGESSGSDQHMGDPSGDNQRRQRQRGQKRRRKGEAGGSSAGESGRRVEDALCGRSDVPGDVAITGGSGEAHGKPRTEIAAELGRADQPVVDADEPRLAGRRDGNGRCTDGGIAGEASLPNGDVADDSRSRGRRVSKSEGWDDTADADWSRGKLPLFPPGPGDREAWRRILVDYPELAPATETKSAIRLLADGTSARVAGVRVDQLRALGNGVVPLCAATAFRLLHRLISAQK